MSLADYSNATLFLERMFHKGFAGERNVSFTDGTSVDKRETDW